MGKMDEIIIVSPRNKVFEKESLVFQGVLKNKRHVNKIVDNIAVNYELMRRGDAEENQEFKQPIPYAIIQRGDEIFVYQRLKGAGETRLHSKLSLGIGGHMNEVPTAEDFEDVLYENLTRELHEELIIGEGDIEIEHLGLINDDEDEVGKVHIALLVSIKLLNNQSVSVREVDELVGKFVPIDVLKSSKELYERLENWSKIVVDIL